MRKFPKLVLGESQWRRGIGLATAAILLPSAAHATSKTVNEKFIPGVTACAIAAPVASRIPMGAAQIVLNGRPSALDRIRANQQGALPTSSVAGGPAPTPDVVRVGLHSAGKPLEPASRTPISFLSAAFSGRCDVTNSAASGAQGMISFGAEQRILGSDPAAELGTLAMPIKRTRFDARWARASRPAAPGVMQTQLARAAAHPGLDEAALLARVNQWVNGRIAYVNDDRNYRQNDFWATAEQTLGRGSGDCEDFAILKMQLLRAAGIDSDRMKLVLLRDLAANNDHAVLLVETAAGKLVLDNTTNLVYDGSRSNSVRPVLSFSGNRRWVHAYRNAEPSRNLLASVPASGKSFALALNDQRSVSAALLTFKTGFSK